MSASPLSPDPAPDALGAGPSVSLWRIARTTWVSAWRLYRGPTRWSHFPKAMAFSVLMLILSCAAYGLDGLLCGVDRQTLLVSTGSMLGMGVVALWVREDLRWTAAMFSVTWLGLLSVTPLDVVGHALSLSPIWGDASKVFGVLSFLVYAWMMVTVMRLCLAKIREANLKYPLK
jgi:hypothetical protein